MGFNEGKLRGGLVELARFKILEELFEESVDDSSAGWASRDKNRFVLLRSTFLCSPLCSHLHLHLNLCQGAATGDASSHQMMLVSM